MGREDPNTILIINGPFMTGVPIMAHHGPSLNAGLVALRFFGGSEPVLLRNSIVCVFSGDICLLGIFT